MNRIYGAPLEGITGFAYRNAHCALFSGIEKYYTPFLAPNYTHHLKTREREDVEPANNAGVPLVPQILTNRDGDFLWAAGELFEYGYREINLNLGCPMPTVVKKHRGSGQLEDLDELDRFLDAICRELDREFGLQSVNVSQELSLENRNSHGQDAENRNPHEKCMENRNSHEKCLENRNSHEKCMENRNSHGQDAENRNSHERESCGEYSEKLRFSVKTRIGLDSADRAGDLLEIYNRYPLSELIVHPRTQKDLYGGKPDLETFAMFLKESLHPVVYNGDIFSVEDFRRIRSLFPECGAIMLGRGLIANPALAREISGGKPLEKAELRRFHDTVFEALRSTLPGQGPLIGKMKELWFYMGKNFGDADRYLKGIRKARDIAGYQSAVRVLFSQCSFGQPQAE